MCYSNEKDSQLKINKFLLNNLIRRKTNPDVKKFQQVTPEYEVPNCIPTTQNPRFRAEVPNKHLPWLGAGYSLCRVKQYQGGVFRAECNNPDTNSINPSQNRRRQFFKKQAYQSASHLILRTIPWSWEKGLLSHLLDGKTQAQRWETPHQPWKSYIWARSPFHNLTALERTGISL